MAQINKPGLHFNTVLYTGNGSSQAITGVGFQPDWVWIKQRNEARSHSIFDAVRGVQKQISSDQNSAESTASSFLTAFGSDGFTYGSSDNGNKSGGSYVSWNWKAGGSESSNSDGTITTSVSANTTAGFSIIKYAGNSSNSTIGHGLGASPEYIIFKEIDGAESWRVHSIHTPNNSSNTLGLNLNSASFSQSNWISAISSSTISIGTDSSFNTSGNNYIAYAFTPKKGYSSIGIYKGNGSSSAPTFIYTGMKPSFVLVKNISQADSWFLHDNKRDGFNDDNEYMRPNEASAEGSGVNRIRLLSNGFSVPTTDKSHNVSGNDYIYLAFAESPFVNSKGVPTNAR